MLKSTNTPTDADKGSIDSVCMYVYNKVIYSTVWRRVIPTQSHTPCESWHVRLTTTIRNRSMTTIRDEYVGFKHVQNTHTHTYIADYVPEHYYRQLKPTYTVPLYGATTDLWGHHRPVLPLYGATIRRSVVPLYGATTDLWTTVWCHHRSVDHCMVPPYVDLWCYHRSVDHCMGLPIFGNNAL